MMVPTTSLTLVFRPERLPAFFPLLQEGVTLRVLVGGTVTALLVQQFGLSPEYLRGRITTLFLNGKAIDNPDSAVVRDGSVLALSGAMPGLVGATMRRGGYYAAMRGGISHREAGGEERMREGTIRIKLFNLLLAELGPAFLREGILLGGGKAAGFLAGQDGDFWDGCRKALVDGQPVDLQRLQGGGWLPPAEGLVNLTVTFRERV